MYFFVLFFKLNNTILGASEHFSAVRKKKQKNNTWQSASCASEFSKSYLAIFWNKSVNSVMHSTQNLTTLKTSLIMAFFFIRFTTRQFLKTPYLTLRDVNVWTGLDSQFCGSDNWCSIAPIVLQQKLHCLLNAFPMIIWKLLD